ncbi:MAG: class I SAM-dependent methyltransferase, partial [bacterium]
GRRFPFPDASFDIVISFHVIEHVDDTRLYLSEIRRTSAPGATILIDTPNRNYRLAPGERPWNRHHRVEFAPHDLRVLLERYFDHVELFGIIGTPFLNAIERARAARLRRLAKLDPLGLRHVLPPSVTHLAGRLAAKVMGAPGSKSQFESSSLSWSDIRHTPEGLDESLVLLAKIANGGAA